MMSTNSENLLDLNRLLLSILEKLGPVYIDMDELESLYKKDYSNFGIAMEVDPNRVVSIFLAEDEVSEDDDDDL